MGPLDLATIRGVRATDVTPGVVRTQPAAGLITPFGPRRREAPTSFVLAAATAPPLGPPTLKRSLPPEAPYASSTRFIASAEELEQLIATSSAVMVMVDDGASSLRRTDGELWDGYARETAGKVDCVRASRATLEAALHTQARTNERARYFAVIDHAWRYASPVLSKRPFCGRVSCSVIDMPKLDRATPPPTIDDHANSLGTIDGPAPLSFEQGPLGDCFFVATLMAVSRATPDVIASDLRENYDGSLTLALPGLEGRSVRFDSRLYTDDGKHALYSRQRDGSNAAWGPLFEKGFAMLSEQGYISNRDGGWASNPLTLITGRMYTGLALEKVASRQRLVELLRHADTVPMVAGAGNAQPELSETQGHAFAVLGVETDARGRDYIVLADPRGSSIKEFRAPSYDANAAPPGGVPSDNDGVFRLTVDDFYRLMTDVFVPADMVLASEVHSCLPVAKMVGQPYSADFKQYNACRK